MFVAFFLMHSHTVNAWIRVIKWRAHPTVPLNQPLQPNSCVTINVAAVLTFVHNSALRFLASQEWK